MVTKTILCEYCGNSYASRPNLMRHQRTVSSCIKLQKNVKCEKFLCSFCKKSYSDKSNLNRHLPRCTVRLDSERIMREKKIKKKLKNALIENENLKKQLKEKDDEITTLRSKFDKADGKVEVYDKVCTKILDKSTVTNNTAYIHPKLANLPITTIHPLTSDYVKEQVANGEYTFDHYRRGEDGIVDFINSITMCENDNGEMERSYVSTDASRDSFHRLVETKEWEKDKGGKFIDVILDNLGNRVHKYQLKLMDERSEFKDMRCPHGYDPETLLKRNTDMHSGIVEPNGKQRRSLRKRIKKDTGDKVAI